MRSFSLIFIITYCFGCQQAPVPATNIASKPEPIFTLYSNELKILNRGKHRVIINVDTLTTITQFNDIRRETQLKFKYQDKKLCLMFDFQANKNSAAQQIGIDIINRSTYSGGSLPRRCCLVITPSSIDSVFDIIGNESIFEHTSSHKLYKYIARLYAGKDVYSDLSKYDDPAFNPNSSPYLKFVRIMFIRDDPSFLNTYLSHLVKGYILAMRQKCLITFHKFLKDASINEMLQLSEKDPLIFRFKVTKKTVDSNGVSHYKF